MNYEGEFRDMCLRKTIRRSLLTALSLDAVGTVLDQTSAKERRAWLKSERASLPGSRSSVRHSVNNDLTVLILDVLTTYVPVEGDLGDIKDALGPAIRGYLEAVSGPRSTNRYLQYLNGRGGYGIAIPIGMACGYYAGAVSTSAQFARSLTRTVSLAMYVHSQEQKDAEMVAFVLFRLLRAGYFGHDQIREMFSMNVVPDRLWNFLSELRKHNLDADYLRKPFPADKLRWATYSEQVCAEAFYYLTRVDTMYPREALRSNPKEQLYDIWKAPASSPQDIGFLFGGLCVASEQEYTLVSKSLMNSAPRRRQVLDILDRVLN